MSNIESQFSKRVGNVLSGFRYGEEYKISQIQKYLGENTISLATLKRDLNILIDAGYVRKTGSTRNLTYSLTNYGFIHRPYDVAEYSKTEESERNVLKKYNFVLLDILRTEELFSPKEADALRAATELFINKSVGKSDTIQKKELERFIIELSWKSSKIEGNTYTLLDTEKLIKEGVEALGHSKDEAIMILNHKKAFSYILETRKIGVDIGSLRELEDIHRLIVENLGISHGLRKTAVGITGTSYLPLSIPSQIEEETRRLVEILRTTEDPFSKALISILGISYIQPFEDGNKRTSRLFSNAILLANSLAPLSYRSVNEKEYREAMLVFYEQNSLEAFKTIFIEQYISACENYNLSEGEPVSYSPLIAE